jgi:hypothetical protein
MGGIFINYRREDSEGVTGRLYDTLRSHFSQKKLYMDIENIEPGMDFVEAIENALAQCDVLLVVIGKQWVNIRDDAGRRRLDNLNDYVRLEIEIALKQNMRIIPVLVEGATMPNAQEIPDELANLTRRNAVEITSTRWNYDTERLMKTLGKVVKPMIHLRSKPLTVSREGAQNIFGLTQDRFPRPLEYIENDFEDQGETVIDHTTGLMWQKSGSEKELTYKKAQIYIERLNRERFAGHNDWRLPTVPELMSLQEPKHQSNNYFYINPIFDKKQALCWSVDTISSGWSGSGWFVTFGGTCCVLNSFLSSKYYVRAVRSRQD